MKKKQLFSFVIGVFSLCACAKKDSKPDSAAPTEPLHITTASLNATTYTPSAVISLTGQHDITISGKAIAGGTVPAISLYKCYNVTIEQNSLGNSTDVGIYLYQCYNITVKYNYITNVACGVYVDHSTGGGIIVDNNQFLNMQGPSPRGQCVQFNTVSGGRDTIARNMCENILGQSNPQEAINVYMSKGSAGNLINVQGNHILGGGPSSTGGGIQLGDTGGSYEQAAGNILVNPGQQGISISGGDHMTMVNNQIFATAQSFSNVGIIVWGQAGYAVTSCNVGGNKVNFLNSRGQQNNYYLGPGQATPALWSTNVWSAPITASILPTSLITNTITSKPLQIP